MRSLYYLLPLLLCASIAYGQNPFTYQGLLTDDSGNPLTGWYYFRYRLYNQETLGDQVGPTIEPVVPYPVQSGIFHWPLDFGEVFGSQEERWLEVSAKPLASGAVYETFPRTELHGAPRAYSLKLPYTGTGEVAFSDFLIDLENTDVSGGGGGIKTKINTTTTSGYIAALFGVSESATGAGVGVLGQSKSSLTGVYGVRGYASSTSGTVYGVYGQTRSPDGYAGYFKNTGSEGPAIFASGGSAGSSDRNGPDIVLDASRWAGDSGLILSDKSLKLEVGDKSQLLLGSGLNFYGDGDHLFEDQLMLVSVGGQPYEFVLQGDGDLIISGSLTENSDRNAKQDIVPVDVERVLSGVLSVPVSTWRYKNSSGELHMGPMAQDFYKAFGLGIDETGISTLDASGAALAAIQGLHKLVMEKEARITELENRLENLERRIGR
jgi:hypothetical protein